MRLFPVRTLFILIFTYVFSHTLQAQVEYNQQLSELLKKLETQHNITFSYASALIEGIQLNLTIEGEDLNNTLHKISQATNFNFEQVEDKYFLISPKPLEICLKIIESQDREALIGAYALHNSQYFQYISNQAGFLKFESKLNIKDTISIKYLGYKELSVPVSDLYQNPCKTVALELGHTTLNEIVITNYMASGINTSLEDQSIEIKTDELSLLPGETDGDILLSLRTIPGITAPNGKAGNLHVRGSTSDQTLILFDNIPIYHKGHYFGAISPYNPQIIDKVQVYRSGFEPRLGGRVGGAIELKTTKSMADSTKYEIGINSYYGAINATIPIIKNKLAVAAAFRKSYPSDWDSPKQQAIKEMVFQPSNESFAEDSPNKEVEGIDIDFLDFNGNLLYNIKKGQISMSYLHVKNIYATKILNYDSLGNFRFTSLPKTQLNNWGINGEWSAYWGARLNSYVSIMTSQYQYHSIFPDEQLNGNIVIHNDFTSEVDDLNLQSTFDYVLNPETQSLLNFGYNLNRHKILNKNLGPPLSGTTEREELINKNTGFLHSLFLNYTTTIFNNLIVNGGVRTNYFNVINNWRVEPRLFLNYKISKNTSIKSSMGLYSQYINQLVYFDFDDTKTENQTWLLSDNELPVVKSQQAMVGAIFNNNGVTVDLEFYGKQIDGLSTRNPHALPNDLNKYYTGTLNSMGMDLLLKKSWHLFDLWTSYTYGITEMDFTELNQLTFETYYDQPHVLSIVGTLRATKNWLFSLGWNYTSGTPNYLDNTFFPEPGIPGTPPPTPGATPSETHNGRFTNQHQLDLSSVYSFPRKASGWKGSIGLSFLNLYDRQNLVEETIITFGLETSQEKRYAVGFAPNLTINIEW